MPRDSASDFYGEPPRSGEKPANPPHGSPRQSVDWTRLVWGRRDGGLHELPGGEPGPSIVSTLFRNKLRGPGSRIEMHSGSCGFVHCREYWIGVDPGFNGFIYGDHIGDCGVHCRVLRKI